MNRWVGLGLLVSLSQAACFVHAHVALPPAPTLGTLAEREATYRRYQPRAMTEITVTPTYRGVPQRSYSFVEGLHLANGQTVVLPEDLLPMAGNQSVTASLVREYHSSQRVADGLGWSSLASLGVGAILTSIAVVPALTGAWHSPDVPTLATGGGFLVLSPILLIAGANPRWRSVQLRQAAYESFDASLRRNLGLCNVPSPHRPCPPEDHSIPAAIPWNFNKQQPEIP